MSVVIMYNLFYWRLFGKILLPTNLNLNYGTPTWPGERIFHEMIISYFFFKFQVFTTWKKGTEASSDRQKGLVIQDTPWGRKQECEMSHSAMCLFACSLNKWKWNFFLTIIVFTSNTAIKLVAQMKRLTAIMSACLCTQDGTLAIVVVDICWRTVPTLDAAIINLLPDQSFT